MNLMAGEKSICLDCRVWFISFNHREPGDKNDIIFVIYWAPQYLKNIFFKTPKCTFLPGVVSCSSGGSILRISLVVIEKGFGNVVIE